MRMKLSLAALTGSVVGMTKRKPQRAR